MSRRQSLGFISLPGERDEEHQFGVTIPFRGWVLDADNFQTNVNNFLDHNNIGASNIFFPITVSNALIRGWELTLRSPRFAHRAQLHLAYSNQIAEGSGTITGGLTDFTLAPGLSPLDHDQRNTLNFGGDVTLPWRAYASTNIYYGSGFSNGEAGVPGQPYQGNYLPGHTTFDLSLGKGFRRALLRIGQRAERRQPPRALRQQPNLRRLPLEPAPRSIRRTALPLPLLRFVSGHGFSRAGQSDKTIRALARDENSRKLINSVIRTRANKTTLSFRPQPERSDGAVEEPAV